MVNQDKLMELFSYEPKSGQFVRKTDTRRARAGTYAGTINGAGYCQIGIDGALYLAHRLVWLYVHGKWPDDQLDHKDRNRKNNRIENLRPSSQGENMQNISLRSDNSTGFTGVVLRKGFKKFMAQISVGGKNKHLGYFDTAELAAEAYAAEKCDLHKFQSDPSVLN